MRLTDLNPCWLKVLSKDSFKCEDVSKGEADGIKFLCPKCFAKNNNSKIGTHSIICWQPQVSQDVSPTGGRWMLVGNSFEDLNLVAGSSSVLIKGGCNAHFFIESGNVRMC